MEAQYSFTAYFLMGIGIYCGIALAAAMFKISQATIERNVYIEVNSDNPANGEQKN